jgi:uncharacterized protein YndB with AHSA1/START domain
MPLDIAAHLGAMSRTVRNLERDGRPAKAVIASRVYPTDPADLWDALTTPARLRRWFAPVHGELRLGGRFQVEGNAGGTITACEPQRRIEATWEFGGGVSWIEVTLSEEGAGTRLELAHIAPIDPHWDRFGPGAVGVGWDLGFYGMALHLADPQADRPPEADQSWFATKEYKDMVRATSDDWGRAALAAGEDRDKALAAAEATRQFYTGEAPPAAG